MRLRSSAPCQPALCSSRTWHQDSVKVTVKPTTGVSRWARLPLQSFPMPQPARLWRAGCGIESKNQPTNSTTGLHQRLAERSNS
ncbi:MAG TPA: hypothetical protein VFS12_16765, partial [Terriglobia bacterium]|nr:hypothetical protein [Terriglobia bacterium]